MTRINTNVSAMVARTNLDRTNTDLATRLQRLSTGLKINRGADDPAGPVSYTHLNTVLSTQLENLFIDKQHSGELRESGEKGWLTRLFDAVFDF